MNKLILITLLACTASYANPSQTTSGGCGAQAYGNNDTTQCQGQSQGQHQAQTAKGGSATTGASTAVTGASTAINGPSTSNATNGGITTSTTDSGNVTYKEAANVVSPATMLIQGCQVMGQAGGSNTRAAAMLGIGFTPSQCYDYIQAQAYEAIGERQAACEILNHTKAAERAVKKGAVLPSCAPPAPVVVEKAPPADQPKYVTQEEFDRAFRKRLTK